MATQRISIFGPQQDAPARKAAGSLRLAPTATIWRWLNEDAIRPWQHRCWIFPRDPDFETKAGRILDLYQRLWKGRK
ncbi:MAG TPA: hypothetical protein VNZ03_16215, partial [Terriglobales bacterium]|nr:hypothetical protein [Terriglobales bacterium]